VKVTWSNNTTPTNITAWVICDEQAVKIYSVKPSSAIVVIRSEVNKAKFRVIFSAAPGHFPSVMDIFQSNFECSN